MEIIANGIRPDHQVIFDMIEPESRVLDLGCGTGDLLHLLARDKDARVQGIELDENALADKIGHNWRDPEAYDADDGSVVDW